MAFRRRRIRFGRRRRGGRRRGRSIFGRRAGIRM